MAKTLVGPEKGEGFTLTRFCGPVCGTDRTPAERTRFQIDTYPGETFIVLDVKQMKVLLMAFCADQMGVTPVIEDAREIIEAMVQSYRQVTEK